METKDIQNSEEVKLEEKKIKKPEEVKIEKSEKPKEFKEEKAEKREEVKQKNISENILKFPRGFLWGTATSAYQIEGGIMNDWSQWEKAGKRLLKIQIKGGVPHDYICGQACDSYNRYEDDFDLAKGLNNNAIRIGIEWSRIQSKKGVWNVEEIEHYREVLAAAKKRGLKTVVTLWHWTIPTWVEMEKGWENKKTVDYFLEYVNLIIKELGVNIDYWVVLNEPMMQIFGGYLGCYFPPQKRSIVLAEKVFKNLVKAHNKSYNAIHEYFPKAQVGSSALLNYFEPAHRWNLIEVGIAKLLHYYWNHRFFKKTKNYFDYVGVDYYFHDRIVWYPPFKRNKNKKVNDRGWEIYPKGIYHVLKYAKKFQKPIFILENGVADKDDKIRAKFIKDHLVFVHEAIQEGADVRGYFHWSLIDNFEWDKGWKLKFGLYEINRKTFERKARPSAKVYAQICGENAVLIKN